MRAVITTPSPIDTIQTAMPAATESPVTLLTHVSTDGAAPDYETLAFEQAAFQLALRIAEVIRIRLDDGVDRRDGDAVATGNGDRSLGVERKPRSRATVRRPRLRLTSPTRCWPEVQLA
jgi:hypothetical protein